jgi:predicted HicB family RNase H-like nuclease
MSRTRKPVRARKASRRALPEELARDAIAHEESRGPDKVRMTFRVVLDRRHAEALAARAIREEKNIATMVAEILQEAVSKRRP